LKNRQGPDGREHAPRDRGDRGSLHCALGRLQLNEIDAEGTAYIGAAAFPAKDGVVQGSIRINQNWLLDEQSDPAHWNCVPDELTDAFFMAACGGELDWSTVEKVEDLTREMVGTVHGVADANRVELAGELAGVW
jgi:hypothetical protein